MIKKINILLADDHDYFLDGLQIDVKKIKKVNNIFRANNGNEVLRIIDKEKVDILISDIQMPELDGLKLAGILNERNSKIKIIILTSFYDIQHIKALLKLDIHVIIDKENVKNQIENAIESVLQNQKLYSSKIEKTIGQIIAGKRKISQNTAIPSLTRRERELIEYIAGGLSNKEIAKKISLSPATIDSHRSNIYLKFEVNNAAKLAVKAFRLGIIE